MRSAPPMVTKRCAVCKCRFEARSTTPNRIYCSADCKSAARPARESRAAPELSLEQRMDRLHRTIKTMEIVDGQNPQLPGLRRHFVGMFNLLESGEFR